MAFITLSATTIPTPQPYLRADGNRNSDNFYYVMLQVAQEMKAVNFRIPDSQEITRLVEELQTLNTNLTTIKTAIDGITLSVSPTDLTDLIQAVQALQYNDQELDFGFLKVSLRGIVRE